MKSTLKDLNDYLFEELERLNDDEALKDEETLKKEVVRSKAITNVAQVIINNADTVIKGQKVYYDMGLDIKEMPKMISGGKK